MLAGIVDGVITIVLGKVKKKNRQSLHCPCSVDTMVLLKVFVCLGFFFACFFRYKLKLCGLINSMSSTMLS